MKISLKQMKDYLCGSIFSFFEFLTQRNFQVLVHSSVDFSNKFKILDGENFLIREKKGELKNDSKYRFFTLSNVKFLERGSSKIGPLIEVWIIKFLNKTTNCILFYFCLKFKSYYGMRNWEMALDWKGLVLLETPPRHVRRHLARTPTRCRCCREERKESSALTAQIKIISPAHAPHYGQRR